MDIGMKIIHAADIHLGRRRLLMLMEDKPKRSDEATPFNVYFGDIDVSRMAAAIPFSRFQ
jgi:hypothetical protein